MREKERERERIHIAKTAKEVSSLARLCGKLLLTTSLFRASGRLEDNTRRDSGSSGGSVPFPLT